MRSVCLFAKQLARPQSKGSTLTLTRSFAKRKKKKINPNQKKVPVPRWTFAEYMEKKDPEASFRDEECEGWNMFSAMILERTPRLTKNVPSWQVEWDAFDEERGFKEKIHAPMEWVETQRTVEEEAEKLFKPNPRVTHADLEKDFKSVWRRLDSATYLILKTTNESGVEEWGFPTAQWKDNETLRETAERALPTFCGNDLDTYLLGNAPSAHLQWDNNKLFLFRNLWLYGNVDPKAMSDQVKDFAWVTVREMNNYLSPEMCTLMEKVLYEELVDDSEN